MPYVDPTTIVLTQNDRSLTIQSPFWTITHDLDHGGALTDLRFAHGAVGNVFRAPFRTTIDRYSDVGCRNTTVEIVHEAGGVILRFAGVLTDENGSASRITFQTTYRYNPYWIRREVRLDLPPEARATRISPLSLVCDRRFTHWSAAHDPKTKPGRAERVIGPHYDQDDGAIPSESGPFFHDARPPGWMSLYCLGGEGFQVAPAGDLTPWDAPLGIEAQGHFSLTQTDSGPEMHWEALALERESSLPPVLTFVAHLIPVNLPESRPAPWRTVMVGNPPFPSDSLLRAWAESGVQIIVIMEGANWTSGTDRFWKTGIYPCYHDERDMADLNRLIDSVHALGMRIIPYTCPSELHPEMPTFAANAREWHQAAVPDGQVIYHPAGKSPGGCYGTLMCPDSAGWRDFYYSYVQTLLKNHTFDGIYVDIVQKAPCYNVTHGPAHHGGLDGLWSVLRRIRDDLGQDRLMVFHNGEQHFLATTNNVADMIVTLEGVSFYKEFRYDLAGIGRVVRAFPACRAAMVPCSTWYRVPEPLPPQTGLRDGIAKGLLLGSIPYSYAMWERRWGYHDNWECLEDPRGLYAAFRILRLFNVDGLQFDDCFSNAVQVEPPGALGARYYDDQRQVIVIANVSGQAISNVHWRQGEARGTIDFLGADEYRFIEA